LWPVARSRRSLLAVAARHVDVPPVIVVDDEDLPRSTTHFTIHDDGAHHVGFDIDLDPLAAIGELDVEGIHRKASGLVYRAPNLKTVVDWNVSPGRRTVEGNAA
jgi:hypothetical protein